MNFISYLLILSILAGQLIKLPVVGNLGPSILDFYISILCLIGVFKLKFRLKNPPLFIKLAFLFCFISLTSLIFTPLHLTSFEYGISFSYILRFLFYILLSLIVYSGAFPQMKKDIDNIFIYSGLGLAILGLLQFLILPNLLFLQVQGWDPHYFRTVSTFLDPNFAGVFFSLSLLSLFKKNRKLFFSLIYIALLTTFSRSSYLIFLVSGLSLSIINKSKKLFLLTLILFIILLAGFQAYTQFIAKPRNIDREQSASFRVNTWQQGLAIFQHAPILGVGFNSYRYGIREYNLSDESFLNSHGSTSNDSSLLFVLATTGILGFIIYISFLISLLREGLKNNTILFAGLTGLLICSIFANSLFFSPILLWLVLTSQNPKK